MALIAVPREAFLVDYLYNDDLKYSSEEKDGYIDESPPKPQHFPATLPKKDQPTNINPSTCKEA